MSTPAAHTDGNTGASITLTPQVRSHSSTPPTRQLLASRTLFTAVPGACSTAALCTLLTAARPCSVASTLLLQLQAHPVYDLGCVHVIQPAQQCHGCQAPVHAAHPEVLRGNMLQLVSTLQQGQQQQHISFMMELG